MKIKTRLSLVVFLLFVATAGAQTLPLPPNAVVHIAENVPAAAASQLIGSGIALPGGLQTARATAAPGAEIVWRQSNSQTDPRGGKHVFYRQYLVSGPIEAEIFGSEIGLHYTKAGVLWSVSGRQFTSVSVPSNRAALTAADAVARAGAQLRGKAGFVPEHSTPAVQRAWRIANSELKVVHTGDRFRYAWFTYTRDDREIDYKVVMDADSAEVLDFGDMALRSNCQPTTPWQMVSASGIPVRPELSYLRRSLRANIAWDRPYPFSYEAYDSTGTHVSILQDTATSAFWCDPNPRNGRAYTLVPLMADSGTVTYRDRTEYPEWRGNAAGDALYKTQQTLAAFSSLGRYGWNGSNGDANVVLDSTYLGGSDFGYFRMSGGGDPRVPPTPWVGIAPSLHYYNMTAALDAIAHEWGHGVISTSPANFNCIQDGTLPCQMHEGWADVIGMTVEKLREPAGTGLEQSSDWTMHEDNGTAGYVRGALDDGTTGHTWTGRDGTVWVYNQTLHREDEPNIVQSHMRGNMLNMVIRLMTEGGQNPFCSRPPGGWTGCTSTVSAQGITKATHILFDTIQYYTPSNARWEDLATYASQAAFDDYSQCDFIPYNHATAEQNAVNAAFSNIGYPRLTSSYRCF